jgi:hypothetical protein
VSGAQATKIVDAYATNDADKKSLLDELNRTGKLDCSTLLQRTAVAQLPDPPCKVNPTGAAIGKGVEELGKQTGGVGGRLMEELGGLASDIASGGGPPTDPADVALAQSGDTLNKIKQAEDLSHQAMKEKSIDKIDQAIALRPNDPVYQANKGDLLYATGNRDAASRQWDAADKLAAGQSKRVQANILASRVEWGISMQGESFATNSDFWRSRTCQDAKKHAQLTGDNRLLQRTTLVMSCS